MFEHLVPVVGALLKDYRNFRRWSLPGRRMSLVLVSKVWHISCLLFSLTADTMSPAASVSLCHIFHTIMGFTNRPKVQTSLSSMKFLLFRSQQQEMQGVRFWIIMFIYLISIYLCMSQHLNDLKFVL